MPRRMLALPQSRPKKAARWSEAEDAMPIPSEAVCPTLPSPASKGLLRCEMCTAPSPCGTPTAVIGSLAPRHRRTSAEHPARKRLTARSAAHARRRPAARRTATMAGL
ncbi:hypothetical protein XarbCFBP8142_12295 [Xanthomonas arboricola]|nr:hypothetical protein XarbCFBP8142_12295 [Xanthomonas arboricola]